MEVSVKIDYVTLTTSDVRHTRLRNVEVEDLMQAVDAARWYLRDIGITRAVLEACPAGKGYHYGFRDVGTGAVISIARDTAKQGVMIVLSGSTLEKMTDVPLWLGNAFDAGWRASRIDVAFDVLDSGVDTDQFASVRANNIAHGLVRKTSYISSPNGSTLYIGSRQSKRMVRIYDKGRQQKTSLDWLRLELEIKGDAAWSAAPALVINPASASEWLADLVGVDVGGVINEIVLLSGAVDGLAYSSPRVRTNRGAWFMTTVLAAFDGLAADDPETALEFYEALRGRIASKPEKLKTILNI